jgi:DMSO/TMAO reductase YedYZ molybdopterin-dependent catalytic subunit
MKVTTDLVIVRPEPLCAESPLRLGDGILTPIAEFYVRNNFPVPPAPRELRIGGAVANPSTIAPERIRRLPRRRVTATLECAGNGRSFMRPQVEGEPWRLGAVSTAEWEGVSLSEILEPAQIASDAVEIVFHSADGFARSLSIAQSMHRDTLVVDKMNGQFLTLDHGAPLRLLVGGWYGMASVKWLARIEALREPFRGHFQVERYVIDNEPVRAMRPRALILEPADGSQLALANQKIRGVAWTGSGSITTVDFSDDGGTSWRSASLVGEDIPYTWRRWEIDWLPRQAGTATLLARAADSNGDQQPLEPVHNELGYANNAAVPTTVRIAKLAGGAKPR